MLSFDQNILFFYSLVLKKYASVFKELCLLLVSYFAIPQLFRYSYVKDSASLFTSLKGWTFCECKVYLSSSLVPKRSSVHVRKAERTPSKTCNAHARNYCRFVHKYLSKLRTRSLATTQHGHPHRGQQQQMPYRVCTFSFA